MRELVCYDCGTKLGSPITSNRQNHVSTTGHKDIREQEMLLDDGTLASNPGTFPKEQVQGVAVSDRRRDEANELEALKDTVPTKKEQKEIEKLVAKKERER